MYRYIYKDSNGFYWFKDFDYSEHLDIFLATKRKHLAYARLERLHGITLNACEM